MERKKYIEEIKNQFNMSDIETIFNQAKDLKVLVIGDTILDQYIFVNPKGRASKDPILSTEYDYEEIYAGGILVIANGLSDFVKEVKLVTLMGSTNSYFDFIEKSLQKNISLKYFIKNNSPTILKQRFIDSKRNNKLFKVEYMNDLPIEEKLSEEIVEYLDKEIPNYDLVMVGDFGHGFINENIRRKLEEKSKFLSLNVQSNSANMGFNYFTLYKQADFIVLDEFELRRPLMKRFEPIQEIINEVNISFKSIKCFLITRSKNGSILLDNGKLYESPSLIDSVKDTIGAGDAAFSIASLFRYLKADNLLVPFIGNCAGGIAVNVMGNKEYVKRDKLTNFIKGVYENGVGKL